MDVKKLVEIIGSDFYTGVPDSQLKALCNYLMEEYGIDSQHHIIAANEGNCVALAAGYHLATGRVPVVYLQNSGEGNIINPVASLLHEKVYAIPMIFIVGWRGEPGVKDEPQHRFQGEITLKLLEDLDIASFVIGPDTTEEELQKAMEKFRGLLKEGKNVAFVVRKEGLSYQGKISYSNPYVITREEAIRHIAAAAGEDPVVSTTGKTSRELFEWREEKGQSHKYDFLTVGSMGHSSSIALGIALQKPQTRVWCIDGDGAVLMHMGAMALIGASQPEHFVHIVINNEAHETVGGMPTVAGNISLVEIAEACGYRRTASVDNCDFLDKELQEVQNVKGPCLIEVKCAIGARDNLGRPTTTPIENKEKFMEYLKEQN